MPARLANVKLGKPRAFEVASQSIAAGIRVAAKSAPLLASDSEEGEHENSSCQIANTKNPNQSHESKICEEKVDSESDTKQASFKFKGCNASHLSSNLTRHDRRLSDSQHPHRTKRSAVTGHTHSSCPTLLPCHNARPPMRARTLALSL